MNLTLIHTIINTLFAFFDKQLNFHYEQQLGYIKCIKKTSHLRGFLHQYSRIIILLYI